MQVQTNSGNTIDVTEKTIILGQNGNAQKACKAFAKQSGASAFGFSQDFQMNNAGDKAVNCFTTNASVTSGILSDGFQDPDGVHGGVNLQPVN